MRDGIKKNVNSNDINLRIFSSYLAQFIPVNFVVNQNSYCIIETCIWVDIDQVLHVVENICKMALEKSYNSPLCSHLARWTVCAPPAPPSLVSDSCSSSGESE